MKTKQPIMRVDSKGDAFLSPVGVVMAAAFSAYVDNECTAAGQAKCRALVRTILAAAERHGYRYGAQLHTLLIAGSIGSRGVEMLIQAVGMVPGNVVRELVQNILGPNDAEQFE